MVIMNQIQGSLEDILKKESHIISFWPGEKWEFHEPNLPLFEESNKDMVLMYFKILQKVLNGPYLIDDFKVHTDRRNWRDEMVNKYGDKIHDFLYLNCLRVNRLTALLMVMGNFKSLNYRGNTDLYEQLINEIKMPLLNASKTYNDKSNSEKISYVKNLKKKTYDFLEFLAKS